MTRPRHIAALAAAALVAAGLRAAPGDAPAPAFRADLDALCRAPHRTAASAGARQAAEYVAAQLRAAGIADVRLHTFDVPLATTEVLLRVDGRTVPARAMQPNAWMAPATGPEPVRGRTLVAGRGSPAEYGGENPEGRIVVLRYEDARRWRDAFALGARAVIFVESGGVPEDFARHETVMADQLRVYVARADAEAAGLLQPGREVELSAKAAWNGAEAANVLAWIPGTNATFGLGREEVLVLSAPLDTYGQVPDRIVGARGAANCAALLDAARRFAQRPPSRHVLLAFLGAEGQDLAGSAALYTALFRARPFETYKRTHAEAAAELAAESAFLQQVERTVSSPGVLTTGGESGRQALDLLRREAEFRADLLRASLRELRLERARAKDDAARFADLQAQVGRREAIETDWNELRRALAHARLTPAVEASFATVRQHVLRTLAARREEVARLAAQRLADQSVGDLLKDRAIVLHLSLDFSDAGPRWGVAHGDEERFLPGAMYNNVGYYVSVFSALAELVAFHRAAGGLSLAEPETTRIQLGPPLYFPTPTLHAGQMASRFGVYGLRLATCHDALRWQGHPQDRPGDVDTDAIARLATDAMPLVQALADDPLLSLRQRIRPYVLFRDYEWRGTRADGCNVMTRSAGSPIANMPAAGALLAVCTRQTLSGFDLTMRTVVQQNGYFTTGPLSFKEPWDLWCCVSLDERGRVREANSLIAQIRRIEMFPCRTVTVTAMAPPDFKDARSLILNSVNDGQFLATEFYSMEDSRNATLFLPDTARGFKLVNRHGLSLLNTDAEHPVGRGFLTDAGTVATERHSAHDLWRLNESRLSTLRDRRLSNDSQEWLHGMAGAALERAGSATGLATSVAELGTARVLNRRVYGPLLASMNDLVKAVVILMLLTIPFAYSLERLLIGTPHIYRQIGWYVFFFLVTFAVLYNVHPAFAIATEPVVIFLAFVIIILSTLVISILLSRFQAEIRALQGLQSTVHTADVSRFGTVLAAVSMGISTMRRRPMRTLLTTVTVILLTFSILSFASFDVQGGILRRHVAAATETRGLFVHHALWSVLPDRFVDLVRHVAGEDATVTERRWLAAETSVEAETFRLLAARADGSAAAQVEALVGIEPADLDRQPDLRAAFPAAAAGAPVPAEDALYLPQAAAERLAVKPGDPIVVRGRRFVFAGAVDEGALTRFVQVDQTPVFPVDYGDETLAQEKKAASTDEARAQETANLQSESAYLPYYSANQVGFIHAASARQLGARLVATCVYPKETANLPDLAERVARISLAPVYVTLSEGIYRFLFTTVLATSGLGSLVIPILLGGLIVFGTMLGSVSDRENEIYAFSALGLAPTHIGMLFFAEASVYAVVGGLGGYILAQVVAFGAGWLAQVTPIRVPEMNYSSMNAIFAILVVMATVLLSTVYPALRASRSANPGVARSWRLPRPKDDDWQFAFPFTVSEYDITGVMSFLLEHFRTFSDCSMGLFLSEDPRVAADGRSLRLSSRVSTAPFDLGVTQEFSLTSVPSEIEGVDEIHISVRRLSGTQGDWQRTNRPFISDLRKQFLIWRSLPPETMELYRHRTLVMLGKRKADEVPDVVSKT